MKPEKIVITEFYSDQKLNRRAILSRDKYHYIVDMYQNANLIKTELIDIKSQRWAEDMAENFVIGVLNP